MLFQVIFKRNEKKILMFEVRAVVRVVVHREFFFTGTGYSLANYRKYSLCNTHKGEKSIAKLFPSHKLRNFQL